MRLIFSVGIWLEAEPQSGVLKLTVGVPRSLMTGAHHGLWGNLNADPTDDFAFASQNLQPLEAEGISQDDMFHWGQTCECTGFTLLL